MGNICVYIDGNNLYRAAKELGFQIDYRSFNVWMRQKFNPIRVYIFIGYIPDRENFYKYLEGCGFVLIFKQTIVVNGIVKGNCDAEMVLKTVSDYYTRSFSKCILVTGDGDFGCLVDFLKEAKSIERILSPNVNKCSILLKNKNIEITYLNDLYQKFSQKSPINEKAPDEDASS